MLLLEGYISNFMCPSYSLLYVEFSDFYVNQSLAGQTVMTLYKQVLQLFKINGRYMNTSNSSVHVIPQVLNGI
jgi:hypothetical protein